MKAYMTYLRAMHLGFICKPSVSEEHRGKICLCVGCGRFGNPETDADSCPGCKVCDGLIKECEAFI